MTLHLFLHEGPLDYLEVGLSVELAGQEAKHALGVHRLKPGQHCLVSDGLGTLAEVEIGEDSLLGKDPVLRGKAVGVRHHHPPGIPLTLVQALAKGDRDLDAIEMSTELGVMEVMPWSAERSIVQWPAGKAAKQAQKWRSQLTAAAKQSRNPFVPLLCELHSTKQLAAWVRTRVLNGVQVMVLHESAESTLVEQASAWEKAPRGIVFIVGPEGGISPAEVRLLTEAGARTAGLGSLILRASSAGPAAISTVQALKEEARR